MNFKKESGRKSKILQMKYPLIISDKNSKIQYTNTKFSEYKVLKMKF